MKKRFGPPDTRTKNGRYSKPPSETKLLVDAALTNATPAAPCPECGRMYNDHMHWCSQSKTPRPT